MTAPDKIYVEVCEDGIFAFPEPPFKESVEYIRADIVGQSIHQEQPEVDLDNEREKYFKGWTETDEGIACHYQYVDLNTCYGIARHFYELGLNARKK